MTPARVTIAGRSDRETERPEYYHAGGQHFLPANDAAWAEVAAFNRWVDDVNARSTRRHGHVTP